jgi:hypothetical protein
MHMTMAERLMGLLETITDLLGSVGLLSIDIDPLRRLPQVMGQLILLAQITKLRLNWAKDHVGELKWRIAELLVAVCHGANNPIVLDEEEIRVGSPMPLMICIEWENTHCHDLNPDMDLSPLFITLTLSHFLYILQLLFTTIYSPWTS